MNAALYRGEIKTDANKNVFSCHVEVELNCRFSVLWGLEGVCTRGLSFQGVRASLPPHFAAQRAREFNLKTGSARKQEQSP